MGDQEELAAFCDLPPDEVLLSVSNCLGQLDIMTSVMDLEYLKCLQNASHGPGLKTCMKTAKKFIIDLKSHLQSSGHCKLIECFSEKSASRGNMCDDVDHLDRLTYYLVHLNSYLGKMSQKLTKCLSVSYIGDINKKAFHKCLEDLTDEMHAFETNISSVCGKSRKIPTKHINKSSNQLFTSCQSSSKILQTAIHNVPSCSNIKVDLTPTTDINECLQEISILEGQIGQCILQELLEIQDEEPDEEYSGARQYRKNKKNKKDKKHKKAVNCDACSKYTPTGKITSCWKTCHPYDPLTDVHNPYYNFDKKCGHALDTHCDPNSPAYAVPPPLGF